VSAATVPLRPPSWAGLLRALEWAPEESLRVLVYHRVADPGPALRGDPHVLSATPEGFERQMAHLARHYRPVGAEEVVAALQGSRRLPRRAVLVTFDDAYRDVGEVAWPILRRCGIPALLFVPTARVEHPQGFWWDELCEMVMATPLGTATVPGLDGPLALHDPVDRARAVRRLNRLLKPLPPPAIERRLDGLAVALQVARRPVPLTLSWAALRTLAAEGLALAPHTRTHPPLAALAPEAVAAEVRGSHEDLMHRVGPPAPLFAYPYGTPEPRAASTLRALGYAGAFISRIGPNRLPARDPFQLHRQSVTVTDTFTQFAITLTTLYATLRASGRTLSARWRHRPAAPVSESA
jgi:peptidoglycan/xylan/chitin deacetylase (PgdA/CDA1 family)